MDCDLSVPTFPCTTKYSGEITSIINYLEAERPVGWMEEISKLQDLSGSYAKPNMTNWPVKFRLISPELVLPSTTCLCSRLGSKSYTIENAN